MDLLRERKSRSIGIVVPCLPSPAKKPPSEPDWIHEIKPPAVTKMRKRKRVGQAHISKCAVA